MAVLNTGLATPSRGFTIPYSCRFNDDDSAYLSRTPSTASDLKKMTWSCWVKIGDIDGYRMLTAANAGGGGQDEQIRIETGGELQFASGTNFHLRTTQLLRDHSAWYHIVIAFDSTESETDRIKFWINGSRVTSFGTETYPSADETLESINQSSVTNYIGWQGSSLYWDGYMAELHMIDGTAYDADDFGESGDYGEWKPKQVSGLTYGNNGFYLDFSDSAALGDDAAGSNDWTVNNLDAADQMLDTPTNNFATWNPLYESGGTTFSEGNLQVSVPTNKHATNTITPASGKWYQEICAETITVESDWGWIYRPDYTDTAAHAGKSNKWGTYYSGYAPAEIHFFDETTETADTALSLSSGDILQLALDVDNLKGWCGVNNTWYAADGGSDGNPATGANPTFTFTASEVLGLASYVANGAGTAVFILNSGQDSSFAGNKTAQGNQDGNSIGDFYYTPPSGFLALCTSNLPDVDIIPSEHFDVRLRTGTGSEATVSDLEFQPDLLWTKTRSNAVNHNLHSSLMDENYSFLQTNTTNAEDSSASTYYMTPTSTGYTVGTGDNINQNTYTFVDWLWKAGGGTGVSNTSGTITSTVSANQDAGFSIVSYTGTGTDSDTVGHGLSNTPELVIYKGRTNTSYWMTHHKSFGNDDYIYLSQTSAKGNHSTVGDVPTSSVLKLGTNTDKNQSTITYIAYCFHSVDGYSKVGSYTGNGSTDGTFLYTGFRPMFVMTKVTSDGHHWTIYNTDKATYNHDATTAIYANSSDAEGTGAAGTRRIDLLSNGFKLRHNSYDGNANDENYIYIAFAETPFKYSNAR